METNEYKTAGNIASRLRANTFQLILFTTLASEDTAKIMKKLSKTCKVELQGHQQGWI